MYTQLLEDSTRKNFLEKIDVFDKQAGEEWKCPFCDPKTTVYTLLVPPSEDLERLKQIRGLIRDHLELHKLDLLSQLKNNHDYEKLKIESTKRVRLWISGTINDRRLYEEDPF